MFFKFALFLVLAAVIFDQVHGDANYLILFPKENCNGVAVKNVACDGKCHSYPSVSYASAEVSF
jgi:hypothetical protein